MSLRAKQALANWDDMGSYCEACAPRALDEAGRGSSPKPNPQPTSIPVPTSDIWHAGEHMTESENEARVARARKVTTRNSTAKRRAKAGEKKRRTRSKKATPRHGRAPRSEQPGPLSQERRLVGRTKAQEAPPGTLPQGVTFPFGAHDG